MRCLEYPELIVCLEIIYKINKSHRDNNLLYMFITNNQFHEIHIETEVQSEVCITSCFKGVPQAKILS